MHGPLEVPPALRYAKLAPLKTLTQEYKDRAQRLDIQSGEKQLEAKVFKLQQTMNALIANLKKHEQDNIRASAQPRASDSMYVQNAEGTSR